MEVVAEGRGLRAARQEVRPVAGGSELGVQGVGRVEDVLSGCTHSASLTKGEICWVVGSAVLEEGG